MSASWDPEAAFLFGSVIGRELRAQGYNMSIGGGMDLIREPRNGRNFEYSSEDPVLAGTMAGQLVRGIQSNHIMEDIKHYVLNDQETGRNFLNAVLDRRALRETDLLAFQIAITSAHPDGVMCSYNRVNGDYACPTTFSFSPMSTALTLEVPISIPRNTQHTPHSKLTSMANWSTFQSK
jgi:beta-glucosidase